MTLNLWNYSSRWRRRRELVRQVIQEEQPDLIGFQEACNDWWLNRPSHIQAEQISRGLGYQVVWRPAATYWRFPRVQVGQAVLSRHPITAADAQPLSLNASDLQDRRHPRLALRAEVDTPEGQVNFFVTHLSLSRRARARMSVEVYEFTQRFDPQKPQILVGDFNATPDEPTVRFLTGQVEMGGKRGDFRDAWAERHPHDQGFTFQTFRPHQRLDYIFVRGDVTVAEVRLVADVADANGVFPSDHRGVLAELRLG